MGEELYREIADTEAGAARPCRVYAPVGSHEDLLPYLVRRLLENGANTSFVNRIVHAELPADDVVEHPVDVTAALGDAVRGARIPRPAELFGESLRNSAGLNLADDATLAAAQQGGLSPTDLSTMGAGSSPLPELGAASTLDVAKQVMKLAQQAYGSTQTPDAPALPPPPEDPEDYPEYFEENEPLIVEYLGLDVETMREAGLQPGSPEYLSYPGMRNSATDAHPNARAHALLAEHILSALREMGLLPA